MTIFRVWGNAWLALALLVLVLRYEVLPEILGVGSERTGWVFGCYLVYQAGKLAFLLLLKGTFLFLSTSLRIRMASGAWIQCRS